jgi:hypothetical protein
MATLGDSPENTNIAMLRRSRRQARASKHAPNAAYSAAAACGMPGVNACAVGGSWRFT